MERAGDAAKCGRCKRALPQPDAPVSVETAADFEALVRHSTLPVLVDFWAPWCGPCRAVAPELEKLARARAGNAIIAKLNTDAVPDVAQRFRIQSIPTMIRFDRGQETRRVSGAMGAAQIQQTFGL
jgi:thioredoxin 2